MILLVLTLKGSFEVKFIQGGEMGDWHVRESEREVWIINSFVTRSRIIKLKHI